MSGYTPEGFNGDEERDWATDPEAPKAQMRTKEQFLGLTRGEILKLSGADLDTACALLCMDDARWNEDYYCWVVTAEGWRFEPSTRLASAALACDVMIKRGYGISVYLDADGAECGITKNDVEGIWTDVHKTEAEARAMACVLAAWKDGQDGIE